MRAGKDKDKVERFRNIMDMGRGRWSVILGANPDPSLRLWPTGHYEGYLQFKRMAPSVSLLEWCKVRKFVPTAFAFKATARGGDLEAVKWLRKANCPFEWREDPDWGDDRCLASTGAAKGGHLEVLKYLFREGCPWDEETSRKAAKGGHLDVLKYAHENGCPWDERTCREAARGGHLAVLKYAHENGCWWNKQTCSNAALGGHLDVVKYARMNGCPWNKAECRRLAACPSRTHQHVVAWIDSLPQD